ncbi:serine hydrolase domain-containing protein [Microbulbifer sp. 2201CG32-9]|uniref:serine hydrolase domain-containing protein n=1 Tax=Microbulbifer sp. 2201CG32-9 TaxID=3232309 RepID=UPI00345BDE96
MVKFRPAPENTDTAVAIVELFRRSLASISKAVMGTAIAKALESGILDLDHEVQYLLAGGHFNIDNPGLRPITLEHLVTHRSGIKDYRPAYRCSFYIDNGDGTHTKLVDLEEPGSCPDDSPITLAGFLGAYLDSEGEFYNQNENFLARAPGEEYIYSNIGAALAGYSLELSSGFTLADYAKMKIFTPLGMVNTSWRIPELIPDNIAKPHYPINGNLTALPLYELATWPDGGLRSSAYEMALFLATIMNGGKLSTGKKEIRILEADSAAQMLTPITDNFGIFWIIDWPLQYNGKINKLIGHNGADPGYFSYMFFNPIDKIGALILGNSELNEELEESINGLAAKLFEAASKLKIKEASKLCHY